MTDMNTRLSKYDGAVYEVAEDHDHPGVYRVEAIDYAEGTVRVAVFSGWEARARAHEYATFKNEPPMPDAVRALIVRWRSFAQPEFSRDECDAFDHAARELEAVYAEVQP